MTDRNLNIALLPMELVWYDDKANLDNLQNLFENLHPMTDLVILPETFTTGFPTNSEMDLINSNIEEATKTSTDILKTLASKYNVAIVGSRIVKESDALYNRGFFIEPSGDDYYADKRHLFTMAGEDKKFSKGKKRMSVRFRGWNISLVICYDLRFPIWCRNVDNEYDLLIVVANWPKVRIGAWNKLLPARAIENLSYLAAVNCKGVDKNNFEYDGSSHVYDFKGEEIGKMAGAFIYASLDRHSLDRFRQKFPAWMDADKFSLQ